MFKANSISYNCKNMIPNSSNEEFGVLKKYVPTFGVTTPTNKPVFEIASEKLTAMSDPMTGAVEGDAFYICDLGQVFHQHIRWISLLPRVEPFYAIKCNPDPMIVKLLATLGVGFDCASQKEIQQVLDNGVQSEKIIYANPCKQPSHIRFAAEKSISCMTFDSDDELYKIKENYPNAELVLRIQTDTNSKTLYPLGSKFGAPLENVDYLLQTAKDLNLNLVGVSFHVGSACTDETAFADALYRAKDVFNKAKEMGYNFTLLDIGGGFPGCSTDTYMTFEKIAAILGPLIDTLFSREVRVIAEPGRYYASAAYTLFTNVIGARCTTPPSTKDEKSKSFTSALNQKYMYYLNEGKYGTFSHVMMQTQQLLPKIFMRNKLMVLGQIIPEAYFESSIWGQTCDSSDCLSKSIRLPKLQGGDWVYFENVGAYSTSIATPFNGFKPAEILYTNTFC